MKKARIGITAPFIVIDTDISPKDAVEQDLHVLDAVDGHARLADIAHHAGVVAVIAAMGGQVESDRQALLPRRQIAAIESVRFLGGGKARVLADRPGRPAYIWRARRA
jgi:hypothetical protein